MKRTSSAVIALVLLMLIGVSAVAPSAGAAGDRRELVVDDDGGQCKGAPYTSIQPALDDARPGSTVRVCAGTYPGDLVIAKGITLVAKNPAAPSVDCMTGAAPPANASTVIGAVLITGTGAEVDGFVVTGAPTGISTDENGSGYRIRRNLITGNAEFGIELESSGAHETVVERNCIISNPIGGIVSEAGTLRRATIRSNTVAGTVEGITTLGPHPHYDITISDNTVRLANFGIYVSGTVGSDITGNDINLTAPPEPVIAGAGVGIGGGNIGLTVSSNSISNVFGTAIYVQREGARDVDPRTNIGILVTRNTLPNNVGSGLRVEIPATGRPANLTSSLIYRNTADHSGVNGFAVTTGNDGNVLLANTSTENGRYGIALLGAINTSVVANSITGNGRADAHDDAVPQNHWIANSCATDEPAGAICAAAPARTTKANMAMPVPNRPEVDQSRWPCLRVPVWDVNPTGGGAWVWASVAAPDAPADPHCGADHR